MKERICSVLVSLSCTAAPATGWPLASVTMPWTVRVLASSVFLFCAESNNETASSGARIYFGFMAVCLSLLRFRLQHKSCIGALSTIDRHRLLLPLVAFARHRQFVAHGHGRHAKGELAAGV